MTYFQEWNELTDSQTDESFKKFWDEYSDAESRIYTDILTSFTDTKKLNVKGTFKELADKYETTPVLLMGFLDGIKTSLTKKFPDLDTVTDDTALNLNIDAEKLYFNMHSAGADHLYTLEAWDGVLSEEKREEIEKEYRRSRTVRKEKTPGRNDPCPCGSGEKYKKCCGA